MFIYIFGFSYFLAIIMEQSSAKTKIFVLQSLCFVLAVLAGIRDPYQWADAPVYYIGFTEYTNDLFNFSFYDVPYGYLEKGFYMIGVIVKTFTNNGTAYFMVLSLISFLLLYRLLRKYCFFPLLGLSVYVARFMFARHYVQIRAGLAYLIVLYAIKYVKEQNWKMYFGMVFIAYLFHRSAVIAIPLYFLGMIRFTKWHILFGIAVAFILGAFFQDQLKTIVSDNASDLDVYSYTVGKEVEEAKGLRNPMIYYQTIILLVYTFGEKKLKLSSNYYYTIRDGYFISTFILIAFSMFLGLSGRTSSLFATLEIVIIPSIIHLFRKRNKMFAYLGIGVILTIVFYVKYKSSLG